MPVDYLYGLKQVELCARTSEAIGKPYGYYLPSEKVIRLFSVPPTEWRIDEIGAKSVFQAHGADVEIEDDSLLVRWKRPVDVAYLMYREVFLHELGHHFDNQYRHKKKWPDSRRAEEASATRRAYELAKRSAFSRWHEFR